jgi:hypothetical protein
VFVFFGETTFRAPQLGQRLPNPGERRATHPCGRLLTEKNPEKPNNLPIRSVWHPETTILGSIATVLYIYTVTAESRTGEFIMNEFWFTDPIVIFFVAAGLGFLALVVWFIKMDLRHRPKRAKKSP